MSGEKNDESGFQLSPDNHRRPIRRHPGQRADPAFPNAHHRSYAKSPDLSPIEHVWDMMGMRLHLPGKFGKKYRRRPPKCFITLCQVMWQLASRLDKSQHLIDLITL
ncbi:uncharacterized protein TNCV_2515641 [Trichonephila clavipes]|nr:uncharacterized protein TNCV_2515641 [Trichonephila clavipes]